MLGKMEIRSPPGSRPRDGRHCDLCGCSQPAVRCDKCGCQIFCLSCDDMYHRHPKRRFHLRKAVDTIPQVPQARPVLPMKVAHLNATNPGDPSKMPLPPPRKKKSLFSSFRKPNSSSENSPPLPKKEYSWTDRLGSIKKFMSNRPLPPLPTTDDNDGVSQPATNGEQQRGDLSFIHKRTEERPPQLPQRSPRTPDFPGFNQEKENRIPSIPPHLPGQIRNGTAESHPNHMNQNHEFNSNGPNQWNNHMNNQNDAQAIGTLSRQRPFMPPGMPGYPGGMHQSSSATDLHSLHNTDGAHGPVPPHYPHYPMNPHMPPHYPYPVYPGYPNYPQYFGNSFANLSNPPTTSEGDFSDSESASKHSSRRHAFRKRAKRSQSVMMDRMAYSGQFFPFGPYPGYGPWGAPMPMETPPSPASSVRSLNRSGRTRRRKKGTSEDDDEELSETSSPMSRPKSSSSDPKEARAPLATQTTSSEDESDDNRNKRRNKSSTIRRQSEPIRSPSPTTNTKTFANLKKSSSKQSDSDNQDAPSVKNEKKPLDSTTEHQQPVLQSPVLQRFQFERSPTPVSAKCRSTPTTQSTQSQQGTSKPTSSASSESWECKHCTFINPIGNRICQVCCKTATPRTATPVSEKSRPSSSSASNRKESVGSENEYFDPIKESESDVNKKEKQDMASLNSALDEAEKQISKGLEELMKLKDDIDASASTEKPKSSEIQTKTENEGKPTYKSSGRMRTSILDKLNLNKPQVTNSSVSTSTETQTDSNARTVDKIIEARRHSASSTASETYNSPLAQSPELDRAYPGNKQKRDSSCQTQQDSITEYLEKRKAAEEAFLGRPINNFGFGYADRMDMVTSPVPSMYDRFYGGGYGLMQRSHSRASLFTGRMNDFGPMDYGPGFGYGSPPMYRSVSRGSLTGDYPDGRLSEFQSFRKPEYYLSMEELVERRRQDNIRAQGLELVRMIREAEQQGFNADDIQVALTHCGKQNPLEWLQENWRNMVDSVVTLSTNYGNDKKENDIGFLSENEAREALRLHKGNIWAAVTECVEGRQRKYLELCARGNFSRQDIVDALASSEGDVEMAYAKLTKSTGKPFLMRIWGQGEGAQNQDGAQPMFEDFHDGPRRYLKDDTLNNEELSDDLWSEDGDEVDWDDEEEMDGERGDIEDLRTCQEDLDEERGDGEDLRTCQEDLLTSAEEMRTPESEKSDYLDAYSIDDRNASSPSDDIFFVIPEAKPEKKKSFLSKLAALRKDSKEKAETVAKEDVPPKEELHLKEDSSSQKVPEQKNVGTLNTLKNKFSAIKDTVTGGAKSDKKMPSVQLERRTIIVKGQIEHESLSAIDKDEVKLTPTSSEEHNSKLLKPNVTNKEQIKQTVQDSSNKEKSPSPKVDSSKNLLSNQAEKMMDENNTEKQVKVIDSKNLEDKNSQSLTERLIHAKQARPSTDIPGPSGTNENIAQSAISKQGKIEQVQKETKLQKSENENSGIVANKEMGENEKNTHKALKNHKEDIIVSENNQKVIEDIANKRIITHNDIQNTEITKGKSSPLEHYVSKESKLEAIAGSSNSNSVPNKSPDIPQTKVENSSKGPLGQKPTSKQTNSEILSRNQSEKNVLPNTEKIKEISSISDFSSKDNNVDKTNKTSVKSEVSEADSGTTVLKSPQNEIEKEKSAHTFEEKISPKVFAPKNDLPPQEKKNEKTSNATVDMASKPNDKITKQLHAEKKTVQKIEGVSENKEKSPETPVTPNISENILNSESAESQKAKDDSKRLLLEENKLESSIKEKHLAFEINEKESSNDTVQKIQHEISPTNELKISQIAANVPLEHNAHIENTLAMSSKQGQAVIDANVDKNINEIKITDTSIHKTQINTEQSENYTDDKIIKELDEKISDSASIKLPQNPPISGNSTNQMDIGNGMSITQKLSEVSSESVVPNNTNIAQNIDVESKEDISVVNNHTENLPQTFVQNTVPIQENFTDNSTETMKSISENASNQVENNNKNNNDARVILPENNKDPTVVNEMKQAESSKFNKNDSDNFNRPEIGTNSSSLNNSLTNLLPDKKTDTADEVTNLKDNIDILNKSTNEQHKDELPLIKKEPDEKKTADAMDSSDKNSKSESGSSVNNEIKPLEVSKPQLFNTRLENTVDIASEKTQNTSFSDEKQNSLIADSLLPVSKEDKGTTDISDNSKVQETKITSDVISSKVPSEGTSNETQLQAPIFSKKFPIKNFAEVEMSADISNNSEVTTISQVVNNSETSEAMPTTSDKNIPDSLKISENDSKTSVLDDDKIKETTLNLEKLDNAVSSSKDIQGSSDISEETTKYSVNSLSTNIDESSIAKEKTLIVAVAEPGKTEQNPPETNINSMSASDSSTNTITIDDSTTNKTSINTNSEIIESTSSSNISDSSKLTEIVSNNNVAFPENSETKITPSDTNVDNASIHTNISETKTIQASVAETLPSFATTSTAEPSSSNVNTSDSSKAAATSSNDTVSGSTNSKEIPTSEHSNSSVDEKSLNKDTKTSIPRQNEQHSNVPKTATTNSSGTNSLTNSRFTRRDSLTQNRKFQLQRSVSEDKSELKSSDSEDTDTEYSHSDSSRRGSMIYPSPVDTLRSRFEGLASGAIIKGEPARPLSPFRRMSFNSRKQVIALERKRDTSADKPWFHKIDPEPVKVIQPKRSVKQQLEMERKVRKMVADRKCRTYKKAEIVVQLMEMNFEEEEAIQAANECNTLEQAISYLQQECLLCAGHFPVSQIISMTHCEHRACRECIRAYFTVQIRDRTILDLLCPFCNEPDIGDEDIAQDYFNHLDIMLKKLVDIDIHELFQRKLRDRVLMKDPNFRWCSQCSSGFIAMPNLTRLICPDCNAVTCASCRRLWEKEHQGISCEAFAALKDATDPEAQAAGLAKLLTEDGISCPSCHFRYALAKGGCMHFRCIQCQHDFCSGCSRPFKMGQKCGVSEFCAKLGLHAHHPRNCLFYLRDKEPEDLQKLLDMNDIKYNKEPPEGMELRNTCQVLEQKETADGMIDDYCGKEVQEGYAGLCRVHYVEYLGQLVNKHKVDPIQIFDNDDLELVLKRANIRLPPRRYRENEMQYREKLINVIQEELPLDRMDGS